MLTDELDRLMDVDFKFRKRPVSIPPELRPLRRIALVVLIIDKCRGGCATHQQLHVLNWAIRTKHNQYIFLEYLDGMRRPDEVVIKFDPYLDRATIFAEFEKLVQVEITGGKKTKAGSSTIGGYRVSLTEMGKSLVDEMYSVEDMFVEEKDFLASIRGKFTQTEVAQLFGEESK